MDLREGQLVAGRFRLERELGQGGMGAVWRARHESLDMPCALKFIIGPAASRDDVRERFKLEARAAARLNDPHVVKMMDFGVWEDLPFIAMEILDGENLGERLARETRLSRSETIAIATDVAAALEAAHAAGIVHRDLKPENIFLLRSGGVVAKVLDFGIAKLAGTDAAPITMTGALLGTPHYMSPEQAHGAKKVDYRADLWSLAVVVYQCITGRRPFEGESLGELICTILSGHKPVPSEDAPGVPRGFDAWWETAAAAQPRDRFTNATAMISALCAALYEPLPEVITTADGTRLGDLARCDTDPVPRAVTVNVDRPPAIPSLPVRAIPAPSISPADTLGGSVRPIAPAPESAPLEGTPPAAPSTKPDRRAAAVGLLAVLATVAVVMPRPSPEAKTAPAAAPAEVIPAPPKPRPTVPPELPVVAPAPPASASTPKKMRAEALPPAPRRAPAPVAPVAAPEPVAEEPIVEALPEEAPPEPPPAARSWSTAGDSPSDTTVTGTTTIR